MSSAIFEGSLPPASAKSGRPPPPPPTIGAISLTMRPAWIREVRSLVTETTSATLPSFSEAMTTTPLPSRSRSESDRPRRAPFSRPLTCLAITLTPLTSRVSSCAPAVAPLPPVVGDRAGAGERLDAADARGDAAFLGDHERADVAGRADVGAAAQLL